MPTENNYRTENEKSFHKKRHDLFLKSHKYYFDSPFMLSTR